MIRICGMRQRIVIKMNYEFDTTDHLDAFDLGFDDAVKGNYQNPFDEALDVNAFEYYELGFEAGMNAK
jgi:predicted O-methyltransferase YrrM